MKRLASRKSHSWWWDSHISPKNSKWLSENLEKMDLLVKEMLKLIEEEGDTFAKKAEMYYRRRPELISRVEDFYRMYRALAERYDILTGELRKNIPSDLQSQGSGNCSDFGTEPASPSFSLSPDRTPERKQKLPKPLRAAGFDVFLGSTTSSDFSRKGSDDSSSASSSESGSESEDGKIADGYENSSGLNARIIQLEDQLREAMEKLKEYEQGSNGQCVHLVSIDEHHDAKDETEISNHESEIKSLKEAMEAAAKQFEAEISVKDHTIEEYKTQLDEAMNKFMVEKSTLESEFKNNVTDLELEVEKLSEKKSSLEIRILVLEQMIKELKVMSAESVERLLHEKSLLESKVFTLMDSVNIHESKLQALQAQFELHPESEDRTIVLEAEISNHKDEIKCLKEAMEAAAKQFECEISIKDHTIEEYKTQLDEAMNKFTQQNSTLEAELKRSIADLKMEAKQLSEKNSSLEIIILTQEQVIKELKVMSTESSESLLHEKSKLKALEDRIRELEVEKMEACNTSAKRIDELNQSIDGSKLKIDMLRSENDELNARVSKLMDDAKCRDEDLRSMTDHLHQLHIEHVNLKALEDRIRELEVEKMEACNASAKRIVELNQSLDGSKLKIDMLRSEKDELNARVSKLMDDAKCRDDDLRSMADHLHQLHIEHVNLKALEDRIRELEVEKMEACDASAKRIDELNQSLDGSKLKIDMLRSEKDELNARVSKLLDDAKCRDEDLRSMADHLHQLHIEHVNLKALEDRIRELEVEKMEACDASAKRIDELNQSLDGSKLKIDILRSEKDELNDRVSKLMDDAKCRDDDLRGMADHMHQLHIEHVNLIKEIEEARKNSVELMNRVRELEEDVQRQKVLILDGAEGKREAIRQLCFSLEHYRDGYQKLRQMLQGHTRRVAVMAT